MPPEPEDKNRRDHWRRSVLFVFLLLFVPVLVFSNTLQNAYHLDSVYRVKDNAEITRFWPPWRFFVDRRTGSTIPQIAEYRPMMPLSLSMDAAIAGWVGVDRLVGHRIGNIVIHLATTVLFYALFYRLLILAPGFAPRAVPPVAVAFTGALIFSVHPVSGVPINYVAARDLLLMMLFLSAALFFYVRMRRRGDTLSGWCTVLALYFMALLSKQNAIMAFAVIFLLEILLFRTRFSDWRLWARTAAFLPGIAGILLLDWVTAGPYGLYYTSAAADAPIGLAYPLTMAKAHLFYYGRNIVWPFEMRPLPSFDLIGDALEPAILLGIAFIIGSLVISWCWRNRYPVASFAIMAYWALFSLTSSIFPFEFPVTDYRQYPSLPFLALLVAMAIAALPWRGIAVAGMASLTGYFAVSAYGMNMIWRTGESLWGHSVRYGARETAHMNYAMSVAGKSPELAERHFKEALRLYPNHIYVHINLGLFYIRQGKSGQGLALVETAVRLNPKWGLSHYWLGQAYRRTGQSDKALVHFRRAADLDPRSVLYLYEAARALQVAGQVAASMPYLDRLQTVDRHFRDTLFLVGWGHQSDGRTGEAIVAYRSHLRRNPNHTKTRYNLGYALMQSGRCADAVTHFHHVLAQDSTKKAAHRHLADCYKALGNATLENRHRAEFNLR